MKDLLAGLERTENLDDKPAKPEALNEYLKGMHYFNRGSDKDAARKSIELAPTLADGAISTLRLEY
jgi:hypothetical protein